MKCLNTRAKLTIQKLYEAMYDPRYMIEEGIYARIDSNPAYMPVVIEKVGHLHGYGEIISIAHYSQKNGDPMADPDMEFVIVGGDYYPISYRNDYLAIYQHVFVINHENRPIHLSKYLQKDLAEVANLWLSNIKKQQDI